MKKRRTAARKKRRRSSPQLGSAKVNYCGFCLLQRFCVLTPNCGWLRLQHSLQLILLLSDCLSRIHCISRMSWFRLSDCNPHHLAVHYLVCISKNKTALHFKHFKVSYWVAWCVRVQATRMRAALQRRMDPTRRSPKVRCVALHLVVYGVQRSEVWQVKKNIIHDLSACNSHKSLCSLLLIFCSSP